MTKFLRNLRHFRRSLREAVLTVETNGPHSWAKFSRHGTIAVAAIAVDRAVAGFDSSRREESPGTVGQSGG